MFHCNICDKFYSSRQNLLGQQVVHIKMPPREQFTRDQRNFLALEYHKHKGTKCFKDKILDAFQAKYPGVRRPGTNIMRKIWKKQLKNGTVNNCNSKSSPGPTHSGRPKTARTPPNIQSVKAKCNRDAQKVIGDANVSPVSSARRNFLALTKSSFSRIIKLDIR